MKTVQATHKKLPTRKEALAELLPPFAIQNERQLDAMIEVVDSLMALRKLTKGQAMYMETLVQLIEAYEAKHHAIETDDISGVDMVGYLLDENDMNASDLSRLLGVHVSMGSKILNGDRSLTLDHIAKLSFRFKVEPQVFISKVDFKFAV